MPSGVWRNGSASDSRSEGWEFESLCPHFSVSGFSPHHPAGGATNKGTSRPQAQTLSTHPPAPSPNSPPAHSSTHTPAKHGARHYWTTSAASAFWGILLYPRTIVPISSLGSKSHPARFLARKGAGHEPSPRQPDRVELEARRFRTELSAGMALEWRRPC